MRLPMFRRVLLSLIVFISGVSLFAQTRVDSLRRILLNPGDGNVLVAAHRGLWKVTAENSLESIEAAIEAGIDIVELDVKRTRDGVLILMHDKTLGRTTNGFGPVYLRKYKYIQGLCLEGPGGKDYKVPTLEEALLKAKGKILVNIDGEARFFDDIYKVVLATGTENQVIFKSRRHPDELKQITSVPFDSILFMPKIPAGPGAAATIEEFRAACNPVAFEITGDYSKLNDSLTAAYGKHYRIWINSLWSKGDYVASDDPDAAWKEYVERYSAGIIQTDLGPALREYLDARKNDRYVIMVSLDGFRWDYPEMYDAPNIDAIAANGVSTAMRASYPASTFPNHYAIATGLVPDHHGIVNNSFWAPDQNDYYSISGPNHAKGEYFLGEPIWLTAAGQNVKSGTIYWVGSDVPIQGKHPTYWRPYADRLSYEDRVKEALSFLDMPPSERPRLIMLYFDEPDHTGHACGPYSEEVRVAVARVDEMIGLLRQGIAASGFADNIDLIVLSDHGMTSISREREINPYDYVDEDWIEHMVISTPTSVFTKPEYRQDAYDSFSKMPHVTVWYKEDIPAELQYGTSDRIGNIVIAPDLGWQVCDKPKTGLGAHGYSPYEPDMQPIFRAEGPDFKQGFKAEQFQNICVYPLACHLLGIEPAPCDGNLGDVLQLLK